eukprot:TRINITY_DN440_c0_g2_i1.p1 TRINITY_DN440_c0_g2~~TRINITY_DN440_c0_g2_i1.p1  ORF type:complete len:195 (-),score=77.33 TRINITY_DN440_c0_g2_i1:42-578(-)
MEANKQILNTFALYQSHFAKENFQSLFGYYENQISLLDKFLQQTQRQELQSNELANKFAFELKNRIEILIKNHEILHKRILKLICRLQVVDISRLPQQEIHNLSLSLERYISKSKLLDKIEELLMKDSFILPNITENFVIPDYLNSKLENHFLQQLDLLKKLISLLSNDSFFIEKLKK